MMISGAEIVIRCLQEEKVECVFGYPGGSVLHIYDDFSSRIRSSTFWFAMSRRLCMRLMPIRVPRRRLALLW
jgi:hypothetical protein